MKKILFFVLFASTISYSQLKILRDSTGFTRPSNATAYAAGDIVRDSATVTLKFLKWSHVSQVPGEAMYLTALQFDADTSNATNANFEVVILEDTTGMGAALPADNAAHQTSFATSANYIATIPISLATYGTAGGGATGARAKVENLNIPLRTNKSNGNLYGYVIAQGAYTPKSGGKFAIRIWVQK
jgi:zona occludens toxin (predicted ATPase)